MKKAADEIGYNFSGVVQPKQEDELYSLRYSDFVVPLVKAVQELNVKVEQLGEENVQLKSEMKELIARIESLEKRNND